jgi:hypothetical protein
VPKKPTLEEMAEACDDEASRLRGMLKHIYEFYPDAPPRPEREHEIAVFDAAAHLMRVLGTYEDESRKFIAGLIKRHRAL